MLMRPLSLKEAEEETPDETSIDIRVRAIRKENGFFTSGYVIQFSYDDGSGITGSDLEKALETYVKSIDCVTVGTTEYSAASSSFSFGDDTFLPFTYDSTYGSQKDSLLLSFSGFDKNGDTSVAISAGESYPEIEFVIDQNGKLKQAATSENTGSEEVKASDEEAVSEGDVLAADDTVISGKADTEVNTAAKTEVNAEAEERETGTAMKTETSDDANDAEDEGQEEDEKKAPSDNAEQKDEMIASSAKTEQKDANPEN